MQALPCVSGGGVTGCCHFKGRIRGYSSDERARSAQRTGQWCGGPRCVAERCIPRCEGKWRVCVWGGGENGKRRAGAYDQRMREAGMVAAPPGGQRRVSDATEGQCVPPGAGRRMTAPACAARQRFGQGGAWAARAHAPARPGTHRCSADQPPMDPAAASRQVSVQLRLQLLGCSAACSPRGHRQVGFGWALGSDKWGKRWGWGRWRPVW